MSEYPLRCRCVNSIDCSNDDPGLILTYFTARSNFAEWAFILENVTMIDSLEIAACDQEIG